MAGRKRIAIVGSGVSGLGALYTLRHTGHEVHLFEAADRLGGHTNTLPFTYEGKTIMVDTGFIVMNILTYPNFIPFLKELGIRIVDTAMTFGVSRDYGEFEWAGTDIWSIFAQRENIISPKFWRMIFDIVRFNLFALDVLGEKDGMLDNDNEMSIGEYLEQEGYSDAFKDDYLIPMTACVWSTGADKCALEFPAVTLIRFMWNHHLLNTVADRAPWLTIPGGSKQYIDAVLKAFPEAKVHLSTPVMALSNDASGRVVLQSLDQELGTFDDVILACHGDQARSIITSSATSTELEILNAFNTTPNTVYLHSDVSLLPKREVAWSAWNYLTLTSPSLSPCPTSNSLQKVSLTYNMNILQHIPVSKYSHVLVTMNPPHPPAPSLTQAEISYTHPLYTAAAVRAQCRLPEIQGKRGLWYAGAWTGYGFHEDGFGSGVAVGRSLGGSVPWEVVDAKFVRGRKPRRNLSDVLARWVVWGLWVLIRLVSVLLRRVRGRALGTKRKGE